LSVTKPSRIARQPGKASSKTANYLQGKNKEDNNCYFSFGAGMKYFRGEGLPYENGVEKAV